MSKDSNESHALGQTLILFHRTSAIKIIKRIASLSMAYYFTLSFPSCICSAEDASVVESVEIVGIIYADKTDPNTGKKNIIVSEVTDKNKKSDNKSKAKSGWKVVGIIGSTDDASVSSLEEMTEKILSLGKEEVQSDGSKLWVFSTLYSYTENGLVICYTEPTALTSIERDNLIQGKNNLEKK